MQTSRNTTLTVLSCSPWLDERIFPCYVATASLFVLLVHGVWVSKPAKVLRGIDTNEDVKCEEPGQTNGIVVGVFKIARLVGVLALLGLSTVTGIKHGLKWIDLALIGTSVRSHFLIFP